MKEIKFRNLRADEIDVRPAMIKDDKATMLLYIDSRAVVRLLNETLGATNWCMEFEDVNGQLVGKLGIWDEDKNMFVYKCDTGSESNIEASKGLFSDCYKRCLSRWGVDELYSAPKIVIPDDGYGCSGYKVGKIEYNQDREIVMLTILNRFGKMVFDWRINDEMEPQNKPVTQPQQQRIKAGGRPIDDLTWFCGEKKKEEGVNKEELVKFYNFYKGKIEQNGGWRGKFMADTLFDNWMKKSRTDERGVA